MADTHIITYWQYGGDEAELIRARTLIDQARELDPDLAELAVVEGAYWYWGHLDYERALYHLDRAKTKAPGNPRACMLHGWASRRAGKWEQALDSMEEALRLDPRSVFHWVEYSQTLNYLHRYEAAQTGMVEARKLDPANPFVTVQISDQALSSAGDVDTALRVTTGLQHTDQPFSTQVFVEVRQFAKQYDTALEAARAMPEDQEIHRSRIQVREELVAMTLRLAGRREEARAAADAAWFRLQNLRQTLGDDYRILHAEAIVAVLRDEEPDSIRRRIDQAVLARPADAVEEMIHDWELSRALGIAGMTEDLVRLLGSGLDAPSVMTVPRIDIDPAFDAVRDDLALATLLNGKRREGQG